MRIHDAMADSRLRFAQRLNEMSEELSSLVKEVDKNRKQVRQYGGFFSTQQLIFVQTKDLAGRYERALQESELVTEKSKNRLDATSDELERVLLQKEGESFKESAVRSPGGAPGKRAIGKAVAKGGMLLKGKNPGNVCSLRLVYAQVAEICFPRFCDKKMTSEREFQTHRTHTAKQLPKRRP
jgi:Rho GTPase-activating protein RGD1